MSSNRDAGNAGAVRTDGSGIGASYAALTLRDRFSTLPFSREGERMSREMRRRVRRARKVVMVAAIAWGALALARAAGHDMGRQPGEMSPALMSGLSDHTHPIATSSAEAQRYFDMGLNLCFAFNHEQAVKAFRKAASLDPKSPMPLWGMAYALGPNINMPRIPPNDAEAYGAITRAKTLAAAAPENERAYVEAMAARYSSDAKTDGRKLDEAYRAAMRDLAKRYPDDLDAQTMYAESVMDLNAWKYWGSDGKPAEDTPEFIAVLEGVLRRDPNHIGANHFYIHGMEASPTPEKALASAHRLETLAPAAGHLVHMPGHIYLRTGDFSEAVRDNQKARTADEAYFKVFGRDGMYPIMYAVHNVHFVAYGSMMNGDQKDALEAAGTIAADLKTDATGVPPEMFGFIQMYGAVPIAVRWRFGMWDEILAMPAPDPKMDIVTALWHAARGIAAAEKQDRATARDEEKAFRAARDKVPPDAALAFSPAQDYLAVAGHVMEARMLEAKSDRDGALASWSAAVQALDNLPYDEPPDWFYPVRESYGGALLRSGRHAEAEKVFREDLNRNPRNGRSLFGLWKTLEAEKKTADAASVRQQFDAAWKDATVTLKVEDL
jgi:tetratricopeptide (TPR) repeat protein